ncbi:MAG: sigma-70 family RNA polymerase sigma factor, partial [Candidatus Aenigmarchaeota archaeon]|nr:sigma-70 family RNA polymerase sigma factor [Candidatus Aenigmarchaeota archaeon]
IAQHRAYAKAFKTVLKANIEEILKGIFNGGGKFAYLNGKDPLNPKYGKLSGRSYTEEDKAINHAIFNACMQDAITFLAQSGHFRNICTDYQSAQEISKRPEKFSELEDINKGLLAGFAGTRTGFLDRDDLYQEGRMVLWNCTKHYNGRNFARFRTMLRASLRNRLSDLISYHNRDKRRTLLVASPFGITLEDSCIGSEIERIVADQWRINGHERLAQSGLLFERLNPRDDQDSWLDEKMLHWDDEPSYENSASLWWINRCPF